MKQKKFNPLVLVCLLLLVAFNFESCKKDNPAVIKKSYFKMKIDGVLKQYDTCYASGFQQALNAQTYYQVNIRCGVPGDYAGLYVSDITPIKEGTYTSVINAVTKLPMAGLGTYRPAGSTDLYIGYQASWPVYDITVTFTGYNSTYISGTFKGKMRLIGGTKVLDITEGEFKSYY